MLFGRKPKNPINQRRWRNFKANRRGWYSLWLFLMLFALSMAAEFLANDKPILVSYQERLYLPVLKDYPETTFGGDFPTAADYRDPYVQELIEAEGWLVWPPIRFRFAGQISVHDDQIKFFGFYIPHKNGVAIYEQRLFKINRLEKSVTKSFIKTRVGDKVSMRINIRQFHPAVQLPAERWTPDIFTVSH